LHCLRIKKAEAEKMQTEYLTAKQLATRWNVSEKTLQHWRRLGLGCRFKIKSGIALYNLIDVEQYENANWYVKASVNPIEKKR
jgi:hypothetical protein